MGLQEEFPNMTKVTKTKITYHTVEAIFFLLLSIPITVCFVANIVSIGLSEGLSWLHDKLCYKVWVAYHNAQWEVFKEERDKSDRYDS